MTAKVAGSFRLHATLFLEANKIQHTKECTLLRSVRLIQNSILKSSASQQVLDRQVIREAVHSRG